jgi:hypothetical protein
VAGAAVAAVLAALRFRLSVCFIQRFCNDQVSLNWRLLLLLRLVRCSRDARKAWRFQCENASRPTHQQQADDAECVECVDGLICLELKVRCEYSLNAYHDSPNCEPQETECPAAFHPETDDAEIC